jgi:transcriptional regulator with XRE-family HTH domain
MPAGERRVRQLAAVSGHRSLARLADVAGVDRHTIVWACRGTKRPQRSVVKRIAAVLSVDPDLLDRVFADARSEREIA